jgi:hypothetical protein
MEALDLGKQGRTGAGFPGLGHRNLVQVRKKRILGLVEVVWENEDFRFSWQSRGGQRLWLGGQGMLHGWARSGSIHKGFPKPEGDVSPQCGLTPGGLSTVAGTGSRLLSTTPQSEPRGYGQGSGIGDMSGGGQSPAPL